jgi:hypothetical protein
MKMDAVSERAASAVMRGALAVVACALLALAAWQYAMPPSFQSSWQLDHLSVDLFRGALGLPRFAVGDGAYRWCFRGLWAAAWVGYFLLVFAGVVGGRLPRRLVLGATVVLALALAVVFPASLSTDVYGYVAYGRLWAIHHVNPYLVGQEALVRLGDPTAPFLGWGIRSPYGPLWMWLGAGVVDVLRPDPLFGPAVAFKLLGSAAVVAAALAGRSLAERLEPGRGELALAAIGLNPLFLVEAAGNGHNDVMMMALVLAALARLADGKVEVGGIVVGLAAALKFVPLLLLPWFVVEGLRQGGRRAWVRVAITVAVGVAPLVITFVPLWAGSATLDGLRDRWARGRSESAAGAGALVAKNALALAAYLAASAWLLARRGGSKTDGARRIVTGWIVTSAAVITATGLWLPWYLSWPFAAALTRWDARHVAASYLLFCFAAVFTFRYSVVLGGG